MKLSLGIDIGSSSTKAAALDEHGALLGTLQVLSLIHISSAPSPQKKRKPTSKAAVSKSIAVSHHQNSKNSTPISPYRGFLFFKVDSTVFHRFCQ